VGAFLVDPRSPCGVALTRRFWCVVPTHTTLAPPPPHTQLPVQYHLSPDTFGGLDAEAEVALISNLPAPYAAFTAVAVAGQPRLALYVWGMIPCAAARHAPRARGCTAHARLACPTAVLVTQVQY
jgi:hypothetical protein